MLVRVPGNVTFSPLRFGTVHESSEAAAGEGVEAVAYAAAAEEWFGFTSLAVAGPVKPFEKVVTAQAPEEEEAGCHRCKEDEWEDECKSRANAEENEDDRGQQSDHQTDDQGEDGHCEGEDDEEPEWDSSEGDIQSEERLAERNGQQAAISRFRREVRTESLGLASMKS